MKPTDRGPFHFAAFLRTRSIFLKRLANGISLFERSELRDVPFMCNLLGPFFFETDGFFYTSDRSDL